MPVIAERIGMRWLFLFAVLGIEIIAFTSRYERPTLRSPVLAVEGSLGLWLLDLSNEIWRAALWVMGTCLLILTPGLKRILDALREQSSDYRWWVWLARHALVLSAFGVLTDFIFESPADSARLAAHWLSAWLALAGLTFFSWLLVLAPSRFWTQLMRQERMRLLLGLLLGLAASSLFRFNGPLAQDPLGRQDHEAWTLLAAPTLRMVNALLGLVYSDLVHQPDLFVVGTDSFQVEIFAPCSGYEGIVLISLFLAVYLWLFRKELRFPQALWLFPLGILTIWLANAVRIASLIAIGTSFSPEVALGGFHSQAGWVAFTLIALGAVMLSRRFGLFTVAATQPRVAAGRERLAAVLLAPFLVLMASRMVTFAVSGDFDLLYPIRVLTVGAVLWYFRKDYQTFCWAWSWHAVAAGTVIFEVWMLLEPSVGGPSATVVPESLQELPTWAATVWLVFRLLGSIITVPLAEEFAFRGYLMRKLVSEDFERVPFGRFSWLSFLFSSVLFGLLHGRLLAGTLAGMGYALILYRRGRIGDAVVAHATTNLLIAVWVLTWDQWHLWS